MRGVVMINFYKTVGNAIKPIEAFEIDREQVVVAISKVAR